MSSMSNFDKLANEFLAQKRIAVAGVSRDEKQTANAIYKAFQDKGYEVFAVNPNLDKVGDDPCYPNMQAIPGGVDGAIHRASCHQYGRVWIWARTGCQNSRRYS